MVVAGCKRCASAGSSEEVEEGGGGWLSRSSVAKAWLTRNFLEFTAIETLYSKASYSDLIQSYRNLINWDKLPQITPFSVSDECGLIQYKVK
jgi:hypothetical protein